MPLESDEVISDLIRVFEKTFPHVIGVDWLNATTESILGWDSFATLTLISTLEQDTGIRIGFDRIVEIHNFNDILNLAMK